MDIVLADAQRLGYAEADPTRRRRWLRCGGEARRARRHRVSIGISECRRSRDDRSVRWPAPISGTPLASAARSARSRRVAGRPTAASTRSVGPALVPQGSSFGRNEGANNVVTHLREYGGESSFSGAGAGGPATAVAVVSDLLALTRADGSTKQRSGCRPALARRRRCRITSASSSTTGRASWPPSRRPGQAGRQPRRRVAGTRLSQRRLAVCHHGRALRRGRAAEALGEIERGGLACRATPRAAHAVWGRIRDIVFVSCHLRPLETVRPDAAMGARWWSRVRSPTSVAASIRLASPSVVPAGAHRRCSRRRRVQADGRAEHAAGNRRERRRAGVRH